MFILCQTDHAEDEQHRVLGCLALQAVWDTYQGLLGVHAASMHTLCGSRTAVQEPCSGANTYRPYHSGPQSQAYASYEPRGADMRLLSLGAKECFCGLSYRDKELAAVKVTAADVDIIMSELEVDHKQADRRLREHHGSVKAALQSFLKV